jgi:hypothetical protein
MHFRHVIAWGILLFTFFLSPVFAQADKPEIAGQENVTAKSSATQKKAPKGHAGLTHAGQPAASQPGLKAANSSNHGRNVLLPAGKGESNQPGQKPSFKMDPPKAKQ